MRDQLEVLARQRRFQECARRAPAPAAFLVDLEVAAALVVAAVEIVRERNSGLAGSLAKRVEQAPFDPRLIDSELAAAAMEVRAASEVVLMPPEIRQHVLPAPTLQSELPPMVVVRRLAAHIDHRVDRR